MHVEKQSITDYLLSVAESDMNAYQRQYVIAGDIEQVSWNRSKKVTSITGYFDHRTYHAVAVALATVDRAQMISLTSTDYTVVAYNHPLPRLPETIINEKVTSSMTNAFVFSYCLMFGMAFLLSTFVILPIKERSNGSKHSQFICGVDTVSYWVTSLVWDIVSYVVPALCIIGIIEAFQVEPYVQGHNIWYVLLNLLLYAWAFLAIVYLFSFVFTEPASGFVTLTVINILSATASMVLILVLKTTVQGASDVADTIKWFLYALLPNFVFAENLQHIYFNYQILEICSHVLPYCATMQSPNKCCPDNCGDSCVKTNENYLGIQLPGIGSTLLIMIFQGLFYLAILFMLEFAKGSSMVRTLIRRRRRISPALPSSVKTSATATAPAAATAVSFTGRLSDAGSVPNEDDDVVAERKRLNVCSSTSKTALLNSYDIIVCGLTCSFGSFRAVDRVYFGVQKGECFGLLGVNGAGKTTTFKMLTGDIAATDGDAFLVSCSVSKNLKAAQKQFGYCSQFDALIDQMTVTETLYMYARLRGIAERSIDSTINSIIPLAMLQKHRDKQTAKLSGGNKRKLSTAIALIGDPPIVFLDEPTTGMDPIARRHLWNTLTKVRNSGKTLIITSHSMEECEALCTRLAIMVNGRLKCLGSTQHLKAKFGDGYIIIVKILGPRPGDEPTLEERVEQFIRFATEAFDRSTLKDRHEGLVHFHVPSSTKMTWSKIFGTMERAKSRPTMWIEDYSVSQTTLEQVFINFARAQHAPRPTDATCLERCRATCQCACLCPRRSRRNTDDVIDVT